MRTLLTVWLAPTVWPTLTAEASRVAPRETGGVLLGWRAGQRIYITEAIGPGPHAAHGQTTFVPDADWQAERIAELYERSGRRLAYLGDWHTHPGGSPVHSEADRATLSTIAAYEPARCPRPVMGILGQPDGEEWRLQCHIFTPGTTLRRERVKRAQIIAIPSEDELQS